MKLKNGKTDYSIEDLKAALPTLGAKDLLLDVRTPEEFAEDGRIAGSQNIDHTQVGAQAERLKGYDSVILYCRSGGRSKKAYDALSALGLKNLVCITGGGMMRWVELGYPHE